ncbi:MAG: efflux RND transporter permease subunit, partial [Microbacteriaceae bacterium]|nr:efflux RND transporter permease subunit [Microbacteriaceae bacterium]
MHQFSVFSLRNRALIALVTIVVAVFGGITLTQLKQELVPSITYPQLFIVTSYPGASPAVVEHDVSTPIEDAIQAIPGLESTTATSNANFSNITAAFAFSTNLATAEQKVTTAINRIRTTLPDGVDPQVIQFSLSDFPIVQLAVSSDLDAVELSDRIERIVIPELSRLDGVASVTLQGSAVQRVEITPDADELAGHGLTRQAITQLLQASGLLLPAGQITEDGETLTVQAGQRLESAEDIAELAFPVQPSALEPSFDPATGEVTVTGPDAVTIGDVADVEIVDAAPTGYSRVDGRDALTLAVTKTSAGNTVAVSHLVRDALPGLAAAVGGSTQFTAIFDQAPFIEQSIESLTQEGLLGLAFAVIVILIFLLSIRSTLVTAVSIPTSVLLTFIGIWASGYTLNIITLGALTIAIGRVVDDSIVVVENIKRHIEAGQEKRQAILDAVKEVAGAITASTITTVAVFLPIGLVGEEVGELFRPFAVTVAIALLASLLVSLTIVPVLSYWFLGRGRKARARAEAAAAAGRPADPAHETVAEGGVVPVTGSVRTHERGDLLQRGYLPVIRWTLKYPVVVLLLAILTLGGSIALAPMLKLNFVGDSGQNTLTVTQTLDASASLEVRNDAAKQVEDALIGLPGVQTVHVAVGSGTGSSIRAAFGGGGSTTFSLVTDPDGDQAEISAAVERAIAGIRDAGTIAVSAQQGFGGSTIDVTVHAATQQDLEEGVRLVTEQVQDLDSVGKVTDNVSASTPYIAIVVDRQAAADHGLNEVQVGGLVMAAMNPSSIGSVSVEDRTLSIYLIDDEAPQTLEELRDFPVPTILGTVHLSDLASVERTLGPASITTEQGVRTAEVSITPATDNVGATTFGVQAALAEIELPTGTTVAVGGVASQMLDSFANLGIALLAAILIVYVVMVATFRSLRQPLLLLVSIPFAATGAIVLQVLTGIPLGVSSLIGVLMLVGIVVTNAIVLVDLVNQYRTRGLDVRTAVEQGAARRLRPIVMTAAATIFALIPLAVGITGHGGFISQPLALIVIGGLVSSTILTLIVLPVIYYLVEGRAERRAPKVAARRAAKDAKTAEKAEAARAAAQRKLDAEAARTEAARLAAEAKANRKQARRGDAEAETAPAAAAGAAAPVAEAIAPVEIVEPEAPAPAIAEDPAPVVEENALPEASAPTGQPAAAEPVAPPATPTGSVQLPPPPVDRPRVDLSG